MKINAETLRFVFIGLVLLLVGADGAQGDSSVGVELTGNGVDRGVITLTTSDRLTIDASLEGNTGGLAKWWIGVSSPMGPYHLEKGSRGLKWTKGEFFRDNPSATLPVKGQSFRMLNGKTLPEGAYKFGFTLTSLHDEDIDRDTLKVNISNCKTQDELLQQNEYVLDLLAEVYYWNDYLPTLNASCYSSPEDVLSHLMYDEKDRWSYIADAEENDAYFGEGTYVGFGFRAGYDDNWNYRIKQVYPGSPADDAGLRRGDTVISIGGYAVDDIERYGKWDEAFGEDDVGVTASFVLRGRDGGTQTMVMRKDVVYSDPVGIASVRSGGDLGQSRIGYLLFSSHIEPAERELLNVFEFFKTKDTTNLILDLRYNSGGLLSIARTLASLIRKGRSEEVFEYLNYNEEKSDWDHAWYFEEQENSLGLDSLVVITSNSTCSASESLIYGLLPFIDVYVIGEETCGKPMGMHSYYFDEKVIKPIMFKGENSIGEVVPFDGIPANCIIDEDYNAEMGGMDDPLYLAAERYILEGFCVSSQNSHPQFRLRGSGRSFLEATDPTNSLKQVIGAF